MRASDGARIHWADVLLTATAAVSWSFLAMTGTAAVGLHLLGADAAGELSTMTAAVVVLAVNGRMNLSGELGVFGLKDAEAGAAVDIAPLGVGLVGALVLACPVHGSARGQLAGLLPDPLDRLLISDGPVTVGRLADLDRRVWLLVAATALMMLSAGVLTAVRTADAAPPGRAGPLRFAGLCGIRLASATALALPLPAWLTDVSAHASLSVLGFEAFGAGIELHGGPGVAQGAVAGAAAGVLGALVTWAAGVRPGGGGGRTRPPRLYPDAAYGPGPYNPSPVYRPSHDETNPYLRPAPGPEEGWGTPHW
ncbi:streptophobe family protein [Streptomyces sp. 8N706]|uniref:streptophobe family protein n=1 Tax=Streptomyces sp. 8N706 TaxID=3457416 RepID=UPI003FCEFD14